MEDAELGTPPSRSMQAGELGTRPSHTSDESSSTTSKPEAYSWYPFDEKRTLNKESEREFNESKWEETTSNEVILSVFIFIEIFQNFFSRFWNQQRQHMMKNLNGHLMKVLCSHGNQQHNFLVMLLT